MGDLFAPWHIVILVVAFMVLFGARKLPGAAQSLGQAMRIFKSETKGLSDRDDATAAPVTPPAAVAGQVASPAPAPAAAPSQQEQIDALQRQLDDLQAKNAAPQAQPTQPS
jgi:sec-independent protein translocase protein TatA